MPFPSQVNVVQAAAVAGDFCDGNPRSWVDAGPGSLVAGAAGVTVGLFAWATSNGQVNPNTGETDFFNTVANTGPGLPTGFFHREQQGLITQYLGETTLTVPQGFPVALMNEGGVWVINNGTAATQAGQKAYANNANGTVSFAASGSPPTSASVTASIAQNTSSSASIAVNSFTGSISGTTLTVTAIGTGAVFPGQTISGSPSTGAPIVTGTQIVSQLTGTTGSTGTYQVSVSQTVNSGTITGSGGTLTVGGSVTGTFAVGETLTGSGVTSGTAILAGISGTGGAGTYAVSIAQTVGAESITASGGTMTVTAIASGALNVNDTLTGSGVTTGTYITSYVGIVGGYPTYLVSASQTVGSETITVVAGTETKFYAMSAGAPGELVKMSSHSND
jgi:hypothetical protein